MIRLLVHCQVLNHSYLAPSLSTKIAIHSVWVQLIHQTVITTWSLVEDLKLDSLWSSCSSTPAALNSCFANFPRTNLYPCSFSFFRAVLWLNCKYFFVSTFFARHKYVNMAQWLATFSKRDSSFLLCGVFCFNVEIQILNTVFITTFNLLQTYLNTEVTIWL